MKESSCERGDVMKPDEQSASEPEPELLPFKPLPERSGNSQIEWTKPKFDPERLRNIWASNEYEDDTSWAVR